MKKLKYATEPFLKAHRYIMTIQKGRITKYRYLLNRKECRAARAAACKGSLIKIFKATHNFHEAWQK